jgi:hypothetical protein
MEAAHHRTAGAAEGGEATDDVVRTIVGIIAEATAYSPQDMRLDDDLEADPRRRHRESRREIVAKVRESLPARSRSELSARRTTARSATSRTTRRAASAAPPSRRSKATPVEEDARAERRADLPLARCGAERPARGAEPTISPDMLQALARGAVRSGSFRARRERRPRRR